MNLRCPEGAEVHGRVARLPAAEEALERRVEHDVVELAGVEEAMAAHGGVLRGDALEGAAGEVGGGAAASSRVQIAVSTVDFPLDASPTNAQTEPGESSSSRAAR